MAVKRKQAETEQRRCYSVKNKDVSVYVDLKYDYEQMLEIRLGLEKGVDVTSYIDPRHDIYQISEIRKGLEAGVDVTV